MDNTLELRAADIESLLDGGATPSSVVVESEDEGFVQILSTDGAVLAASDNLHGQPAVVSRSTNGNVTSRVSTLDEESFRTRIQNTDGRQRVRIIVGTPLDDLEHIQDTLVQSLLIALPALLALIAALIWTVVGRALHPVEAIRSRVDEIGARQLDQRVPVPKAQDEIGHLAVTMNEMLDRLQSASTRQARFVSDASHATDRWRTHKRRRQRRGQSVDVTPGAVGLATEHLRGDVFRREGEHIGRGDRLAAQQPRDAEVGELDAPVV